MNKYIYLFPKLGYEFLTYRRRKFLKKYDTFEKKKALVEKLYLEKNGYNLNWDNLQTYREKMQWEKLYDDNPLKVELADKLSVRNWVEDKIGGEYLIPLLGTWSTPEEIDFDTLPNSFVLKTNCGSGDTIIVHNKKQLKSKDYRRYREKLKYRMMYDYGASGELHYSKITPMVIAEKLMEEIEGADLPDYKFMCFDGVPYYCLVDIDRFSDHKRGVFDMEWNQLQCITTYEAIKTPIPKPVNFEKMIELVTVLCKGFSHVRVDLYNVKGKIFFGEMTFTHGSGFIRLSHESDLMLGSLWNIHPREESIK